MEEPDSEKERPKKKTAEGSLKGTTQKKKKKQDKKKALPTSHRQHQRQTRSVEGGIPEAWQKKITEGPKKRQGGG